MLIGGFAPAESIRALVSAATTGRFMERDSRIFVLRFLCQPDRAGWDFMSPNHAVAECVIALGVRAVIVAA